jgi:hypothetical protein
MARCVSTGPGAERENQNQTECGLFHRTKPGKGKPEPRQWVMLQIACHILPET